MTATTLRVEVSHEHGVYVYDAIAVPCVGDFIRVPEHDDEETGERVTYVLWQPESATVTVQTECAALP